jgi:hypothetical protein
MTPSQIQKQLRSHWKDSSVAILIKIARSPVVQDEVDFHQMKAERR